MLIPKKIMSRFMYRMFILLPETNVICNRFSLSCILIKLVEQTQEEYSEMLGRFFSIYGIPFIVTG
jgi:hypothetical protein